MDGRSTDGRGVRAEVLRRPDVEDAGGPGTARARAHNDSSSATTVGDARNAIAAAARTIDAGTALVVTVWHVIAPAEAVSPLGAGVPPPAVDPSTSERFALSKAREGADLASAAGFASEFGIQTGSGIGGIAEALLDAADAGTPT